MQIFFHPRILPRSMTRNEWRDLHRWRRVTQKCLWKEQRERFSNLVAFGASHPELLAREAARAVNPPLLLHPAFEQPFADLATKAISRMSEKISRTE